MKILYVITCGDRGGAQVALLDLVRHLPSRIAPVVASGQDGFLHHGCDRTGIPFRKVRCLVRRIHPVKDFIALLDLIALIKRERPDVVHAHTSKAGILARIASWLMQTPSVFTAHTWSFEDGVPRLVQWLSTPLEKFAALIGGPIITVSDANTRKALRRSVAREEQIVRIWIGIPDTALRAQSGTRSPVTFTMVARFMKQKDQKLLLRALAEVRGNWTLQLVGNGPLLAETTALAEELGLECHVRFLGEREDVAELLAKSDIFVLVSKWEGLPVSILEAMRAGLPVIASDVGGISEMVEEGVSGLLVPAGDLGHLRDRMQTLTDSPVMRTKMGAAARIRFERDFRIEACVNKTVAIYDALHARSKSRHAVPGEEWAS